WRILQAALQGETVQIETLTERGDIGMIRLDLRGFPTDDVDRDMLERIGLNLYRPVLERIVGKRETGPGQRAGLKVGDRITHVDDNPIKTWGDFVRTVQQSPDKELRVVVERDG